MFNAMYDLYQQPFQTLPVQVLVGLAIAFLWSIIWNGIGLWHSAKNGQKGWFIALLILNTLGLLPIIYLIWFRRKKDGPENEEEQESEAQESYETTESAEEEKPSEVKKSGKKKKKRK